WDASSSCGFAAAASGWNADSRGAGFYYLSLCVNPVAGILAAAVFILPGAVFVRRSEWERAEPVEIAGIAFAGSAAFWAVAFWALRWLGIPLAHFASGVLAVSILALGILGRRRTRSAGTFASRRGSGAAWQWGFVLIVLALRLFFPFTRIAYSGGDMTAHAA